MMMGTDIISIYIFYSVFDSIPISLDESAIMDGASFFTIYFRDSFAAFKTGNCNLSDFGKESARIMNIGAASLYLQSENVRTVKCRYTHLPDRLGQYNYICAGVIISLLPALIVFLLCQKQI